MSFPDIAESDNRPVVDAAPGIGESHSPRVPLPRNASRAWRRTAPPSGHLERRQQNRERMTTRAHKLTRCLPWLRGRPGYRRGAVGAAALTSCAGRPRNAAGGVSLRPYRRARNLPHRHRGRTRHEIRIRFLLPTSRRPVGECLERMRDRDFSTDLRISVLGQ